MAPVAYVEAEAESKLTERYQTRAYGSKKDAYRMFRKMLNDGHPPDSWGELG